MVIKKIDPLLIGSVAVFIISLMISAIFFWLKFDPEMIDSLIRFAGISLGATITILFKKIFEKTPSFIVSAVLFLVAFVIAAYIAGPVATNVIGVVGTDLGKRFAKDFFVSLVSGLIVASTTFFVANINAKMK